MDPRLIALDWGTSALRAALLGTHGQVLDRAATPFGVMHLPDGGFPAALHAACGAWRARWPRLPVLAAGMVGSTVGWVEAPYAPAPAGLPDLAARLAAAPEGVRILPGVSQDTPPDVMRGEEAQILGALARHPGARRVVLPGTHSKWVRVDGTRIAAFATFMTGELFAVLRDHSILGRGATPGEDPAAFAGGVRDALERGAAGPLLFGVRARVVLGRMAPESALDRLSGLLIGAEIAQAEPEEAPLLVGAPALCERYRDALALAGMPGAEIVEAGDATSLGLWQVAGAAGLLEGC